MPSTSSRSLVEPKPKKAKLQGYMPLSFTPLETWTHDICVLGRCDEGYTPNRERNDVLVNAGLGKMTLVFPDKKAKHADVQSFLTEKFSRLRSGGGIEVFRALGGGGGCRPLHLVPPGKDGYSLPYIKERFPQATVYIRPSKLIWMNRQCLTRYINPLIFYLTTSVRLATVLGTWQLDSSSTHKVVLSYK